MNQSKSVRFEQAMMVPALGGEESVEKCQDAVAVEQRSHCSRCLAGLAHNFAPSFSKKELVHKEINMLFPSCHLCHEIGSSLIPMALYLLACVCCGFPLVCCAWCAFRMSTRSEVTHRSSSMSHEYIRSDDIRSAEIVSRSLATAKVVAIRPSTTAEEKDIENALAATKPTGTAEDNSSRASVNSASPRTESPELADEERGPESELEGGTTDSTLSAINAHSRLILDSTGWEVDACAICTEPYEENDHVSYSKKMRCRHNFHPECIQRWLKVKNDCPCCRSSYI
jgi:hypothetical protein